ncbi:MAG: hypothetical protein ACYTFG_20180 [Planctomycetota bacterium]|jgi:hypothetical protein
MSDPKMPTTDEGRNQFALNLHREAEEEKRLEEQKKLCDGLFLAYVGRGMSFTESKNLAIHDIKSYIRHRDNAFDRDDLRSRMRSALGLCQHCHDTGMICAHSNLPLDFCMGTHLSDDRQRRMKHAACDDEPCPCGALEKEKET